MTPADKGNEGARLAGGRGRGGEAEAAQHLIQPYLRGRDGGLAILFWESQL